MWKKSHINDWWVKTKFVYTFITATFILTVVWNLKLLMTGDKVVIDTLINIDQTIAKRNFTIDSAEKEMRHSFAFST